MKKRDLEAKIYAMEREIQQAQAIIEEARVKEARALGELAGYRRAMTDSNSMVRGMARNGDPFVPA